MLERIAVALPVWCWRTLRAGGSERWPLGPVGILAPVLVLGLGLAWALGLALLSWSIWGLVWLGPELVGCIWRVSTMPSVLVVPAI